MNFPYQYHALSHIVHWNVGKRVVATDSKVRLNIIYVNANSNLYGYMLRSTLIVNNTNDNWKEYKDNCKHT